MAAQQVRVLVQLRDLILKGAFNPGERLGEIQLALRLGVSRTPVRLALAALEQEGLIEPSQSGGYVMRGFSASEITDAIAVRGHLEAMALRLVAEHGPSQALLNELIECLAMGDRTLAKATLDYDDYVAYTEMNDRFHACVVQGSGNAALARAIDMNNRLPFAAASAMLPMQSSLAEGHQWLVVAHRQHHELVKAVERREGMRAFMLACEHVNIAKMNMEYALAQPEAVAHTLPGMRIVSGAI